jgi:hypothetical protein
MSDNVPDNPVSGAATGTEQNTGVAADPSSPGRPPPVACVAFCRWLASATVAVTVLAAVAAHLPGRIRLTGVFGVAFGFACGWLLGLLAMRFGIARSRLVAMGGWTLISAGIALMGWETQRQWAAQRRAEIGPDPWPAFAAKLGTIGNHQDSADAGQAQELVRQSRMERSRALSERTSFAQYLVERTATARFAGIPQPWAAAVWGLEIVCGGAAGAWMMRRSRFSRPVDKGATSA